MPRKPTIANENALNSLKHLIRVKSNLKCTTFSEIQQLHVYILKATGSYLSVQTLSRVLGLVRTNFRPSMHTLDILAKYINYFSFDDFQYLHETEGVVKKDKANFVGNFFNNIFSGINAFNYASNYYILQNIFAWMHAQPQFNVDIYTGVSSTPYGRKIFFQDFVNIDAFNKGFGKGLHYYLLHTNDREEKLLAYSLSCLRYYLNGDLVKFKNCFKNIQDCKHEDIISYHPVVIDRFYATVILNQSITAESEDVTKDSHMPDLNMLSSSSLSLANSCYHVGEALLLTGDFNRADDIFAACNVKDLRIPEQFKPDYILQLKIFKMLCGFLTGHKSPEKVRALIDEMESTQLPFLQRDYLSLFLLSLKYKVAPKPKTRKTILESINMLIEKTGFQHFHTLFKKIEKVNVLVKGVTM